MGRPLPRSLHSLRVEKHFSSLIFFMLFCFSVCICPYRRHKCHFRVALCYGLLANTAEVASCRFVVSTWYAYIYFQPYQTIQYGRHVITALFVVNVDTGTDPSPTPIRMQTNKTERDYLRFFLWSLRLAAAVFVSAIRLHHRCFFRPPRHLKVWHTKKRAQFSMDASSFI